MTSDGSGDGPVGLPTGGGSTWIVDLDGVIWLSGEPIGDVSGAVSALRQVGTRVVFVTNNSAPTADELMERIGRVGIEVDADQVIGSADAAASLLEPGESACVVGEQGLLDALGRRGVMVVDQGGDAGVVGWSRTFDFDRLAAVSTAARTSGRLIGTNEDPTHPTPAGLLPGAGSLLAAVATASGVRPTVAGKPHGPMVELIRRRYGLAPGSASAVVVGDQPGTDGRLAAALGLPFALVDSGVTRPGDPVVDVAVSVRAPDFVDLVGRVLAGSGRVATPDRKHGG